MSATHDFVRFLIDSGALRFGDFTTKSGRRTPYFINTGEFKTGAAISRLASAYADLFARHFRGQADNLYGPAYKGIPLCAATALTLHERHQIPVTYTFNRKEIKDHGEGGILVGNPYREPTRIVIIEDVITAGTSISETMAILKGIPNAQVVGLMVAVDRRERQENGQSALTQVEQLWGIRAHAIIQIDDIIDFLQHPAQQEFLERDPGLLERIRDYRVQWGA